ncbi:serine carboxypeptidase-like 1 [Quercus suber]|uniref:Serine carboxypeptidase-like 1 n=1 Tax=Quercus suber TaxID=58331 RepID=A0AAW0L6C5_QUESU
MPKFACLFFHLIFLLLFSAPAVSFSIVKTLPGFSGSLPFKLETGYIGVDEKEDMQLLYYFVRMKMCNYSTTLSNLKGTPGRIVVWITGGPGCPALCGLIFEIGPLQFNIVEYNGSLPTLALNPYSWTKWLLSHPIFMANPLYIAGDSYSGRVVPVIVQRISEGSDKQLNRSF